jgi:hypothetical protein
MAVSSKDFPVGIENFDKLISRRKIYIDKTSFLESLLTSGDDVALLLRPRRFGKTLSMSMIESFLEINYQNPEDRSRQEKLFKNLAVYKNKELCDEYMGRYPVISISLKSVNGTDFCDAMKSMLRLLRNLFEKYRFLLDSDKQYEEIKNSLRNKIIICSDDNLDLRCIPSNMDKAVATAKDSLKFLGDMLFREYGQRVFFIVDEYDVPLQKAKVNGYYDEMLDVVRDMLGNALKTNNSMEKGFVTGCLRIAHQSIFTDINNFVTCDLNNKRHSEFIGLTKNETENLLKDCGMENRINDVQTWYDGYNIAGSDMLCPWSVLNFLSNAHLPGNNPATFMPENYWVNSSGNDIIELCMRHPNSSDSQRLQNLIDGKTEEIEPTEFTTYPEISTKTDFDTFATLMLHTGYFTRARNVKTTNETSTVIKIPNKEILNCFENKAKYLFGCKNSEWMEKAYSLRDALFAGKAEDAQKIIDNMLMTFISFRDTAYESYYHGFMTGVLSMMITEGIALKSNQESGNGYSDIILMDGCNSAVILEFKKCETNTPRCLKQTCEDALEQIIRNQYDFSLKQDGYADILMYGIAFHGKKCLVKMTESD